MGRGSSGLDCTSAGGEAPLQRSCSADMHEQGLPTRRSQDRTPHPARGLTGELGEMFALMKKIPGSGNIVCKGTELGEDLEYLGSGEEIGVIRMQE